jgi:hypothetical protein
LNVPLKIAYEDLFKLARDPDISVAECWVEDKWFIDFKRSLSFQDFERWSELKGELDRISLEYDQNDIVSWGL